MPAAERRSRRTGSHHRAARHDDRRAARALGSVLAARRTELGLSRRELAERAGLSYPFVSELERGAKSPSSASLAMLAAALDLTPAELLGRAEAEPAGAPPPAPAPVDEGAAATDDAAGLDDLARFVRGVVRDELAAHATEPDGLRTQVLAALRASHGDSVAYDDEGDITLHDGAVAVFVRVLDDPPSVLVFSPMLVDVDESPALLERLNEINAGVRFVRFSLIRGSVVADVELFADPLGPGNLELAGRAVCRSASEFATELHEHFGGRLFTSDEPTEPGRAPGRGPIAGYL